MTILVTDPNYEETTSYIHAYTKEVIDFAKELNIHLTAFSKPRLTKENISQFIQKQKPNAIFFNGHGSEDTIYGDKINNIEEPLIELNKNHQLLQNKLVYARACCAAKQLGKECTRNGNGCFIGYETPFQFWTDTNWSTNPIKDKTARLFLEPSNELIKFLLKGKIANEASEQCNKLTKRNIQELLKKDKEPGAMQLIMSLWNNLQGQVVLGNSSMKI